MSNKASEESGTEAPELPLTMGVKFVAEKSGLSKSTVWNHIDCGNLKAIKIGGRTLVTRDSLLEFLSHSSEIPAKVKRTKPARAARSSR